MSYFARLRQQSGLTVLSAGTAPAPRELAGEADVSADLEVTEVAEVSSRSDAAMASSAIASPEVPSQEQPMQGRPTQAPPLRPVSGPARPSQDRASQQERIDIVSEPAAVRPPQSRADVAAQESGSTLSTDAALQHVFRWLAGPPAPPAQESASLDETMVRPVHERRIDAAPPSRTISASPSPALPRSQPVLPVQAASPAATPTVDVEVLDVERPRPSQPRRTGAPPPAPAPAGDPHVEETLTVSIGAIHVSLEGPPAPSPAPKAPAAPPPRARDKRRPASRLARHYLHP